MFTPYLAFAKKSFLARSAYRFNHFMGILNTCLQIFIFWEIYSALYAGRNEVEGITLSMVATNFILSMGLKAVFYVDDYFLPYKVMDGSIANEFLRPVSFRGRILFENMGNAAFNVIFHFTPALILSIVLIGIQPPKDIAMLLLFLVSAALGYGVLWTISFAVQTVSFWAINVWSVSTIKDVFVNVLSGTMIPLWFMPYPVYEILQFTPFPCIYFTPVQIYLGQLSYQEIARQCGIQLIWIILIHLLGTFLWEKGRKKLVVQGG